MTEAIRSASKRTPSQNDSIHLMLGELADDMLAHGINMKMVIQAMENYEVPPTKEGLKEVMWRPIQYALYGTTKTSNLTTAQVDGVFEHIQNIVRSMNLDITFPSIVRVMQDEEIPQMEGTREALEKLTPKQDV